MIQEFKGWHPRLRMMVTENEVPGFIDESNCHSLEVLNHLLRGYLMTKNIRHYHDYTLLKYTNVKDMTGHKLYVQDIVEMPYGPKQHIQQFIIEVHHGGYVFVNLETGQIMNMNKYATDHLIDGNLELTVLIGNARTHKDILDQYNYIPSNIPIYTYRAFKTKEGGYYHHYDLLDGYYSPAFVDNDVKIINDILKGRYSPTIEYVPYTGVEDTLCQPIYNKDILRNKDSGSIFIVNEEIGGFVLSSIDDSLNTPLSSMTDDFVRMKNLFILNDYEIVGTAYSPEELYEEIGVLI